VNDAAIYGQEVEPPAHRQRLARGVPGGLGRSPDAADDADVVEMGGRRPSRLVTADLNSFPDLGQVRYNNCTTAPAGQ